MYDQFYTLTSSAGGLDDKLVNTWLGGVTGAISSLSLNLCTTTCVCFIMINPETSYCMHVVIPWGRLDTLMTWKPFFSPPTTREYGESGQNLAHNTDPCKWPVKELSIIVSMNTQYMWCSRKGSEGYTFWIHHISLNSPCSWIVPTLIIWFELNEINPPLNSPCTMHVHDYLRGCGSTFNCLITQVVPQHAVKLVEIIVYGRSTV